MVIDVHAHCAVPAAFGLAEGQPGQIEERQREIATFGPDAIAVNDAQLVTLRPRLTVPEERYAAMDAMGVDAQLVSPTPLHYHEWAPAELAAKISRTVNESVAALCAGSGGRLYGLGTVALSHPKLAVDELTHAFCNLGLKGVEIGTSAGDRELADPAFEPFWARAHELGAVVFIHPWGCGLGARLGQHYLGNVVGNPVETTLALSHIVFSGLLDRYPGLRILGAHGGGYLPFYIGRADHAWKVRPDAHTPQRPPSEYLRDLYFDSLLYEPEGLRTLVARAGADHVLLGTDYPFDMGVDDPLDRLRAANLTDAETALVAGDSAARLLGIAAPATAAR